MSNSNDQAEDLMENVEQSQTGEGSSGDEGVTYIYEEAAEDDDDEEEEEDHVMGEDEEDEEEDEDYVDDGDDDDEEEEEEEDAFFEIFQTAESDDDDDDDEATHTITLADLVADAQDQPDRLRRLMAIINAINGGGGVGMGSIRGRRQRTPSPMPEPDLETGKALLNSGEFGRVESAYAPANMRKRKSVQKKLWMRELKPKSVNSLSLGESILPNNPGKVVAVYNASAYSGQYSADGSIFASCDKDWQLRIYKTAGNRLIRQKVIQGMPGQWTITDHNLSLDNDWLIYSSITPYVYLTRTSADASDEHHQLDFSDDRFQGGIWSVRFSGDGREIVAGGHERIYVYDIESRTVLHSVKAHTDDVNSVCFAEPSSSHVIFSGSDDGLVKVWDRRSMKSGRGSRPSGILVGHAEGITYVTSKGDNRYLASNGKDQKMLLWDLRKMHSTQDYMNLPRRRDSGFDYRGDQYTGSKSATIPGDCSVMTFQGHKVLRTLIRCHFSPAHSTGQRYLYTGSADGKVAIYRLDGTRVRTLDVSAAFQRYKNTNRTQNFLARDVSWHPYYPTIISSCMEASRTYYQDFEAGLVRHSFGRVDDLESELSDDSSETDIAGPRPRRRRF
ncbi:DDB1- and CUL4-associated factor 11 [Entomortierella parvispora]|uniref:DDB1- and CUL4-associated factor 11 n=1 Tax=Entomortierella parvispora TaxID=205924 RepID=A0A9P3LWT0_9FUNG|nr:DDB1- and CUL4-associated factor 11 [Entomortierella parvispora]